MINHDDKHCGRTLSREKAAISIGMAIQERLASEAQADAADCHQWAADAFADGRIKAAIRFQGIASQLAAEANSRLEVLLTAGNTARYYRNEPDCHLSIVTRDVVL